VEDGSPVFVQAIYT